MTATELTVPSLGGFSLVFLAKDVSSGKPYALKRMLVKDEAAMRVIQNEIAVMVQTTCNNLLYVMHITIDFISSP